MQKNNLVPSKSIDSKEIPEATAIFKKVENSLRTNSIESFSDDLGITVSISMSANKSGFFSQNQAYYILNDFFSKIRPISFEFSKIINYSDTPYATGSLLYIQKGNQAIAQIYISLSLQDNKWVISQFNIYW